MIASIGSREIGWFALFCVTFPLAVAAPSLVLAVLVIELPGLKRYGTFMGIMYAAVSVGLAIGPLVVGRIFDVTRSYTGAFEVAAAVSIVTAIAIQLCPAPGARSSCRGGAAQSPPNLRFPACEESDGVYRRRGNRGRSEGAAVSTIGRGTCELTRTPLPPDQCLHDDPAAGDRNRNGDQSHRFRATGITRI